jgi:hypothetical protein
MQVPEAHRITRGQIVRRAAAGVAAGLVATGCRSQAAAARAARDRERVVVAHDDPDAGSLPTARSPSGAARPSTPATRELLG